MSPGLIYASWEDLWSQLQIKILKWTQLPKITKILPWNLIIFTVAYLTTEFEYFMNKVSSWPIKIVTVREYSWQMQQNVKLSPCIGNLQIECLNSDVKKFNQYQQNEQLTPTSNHWSQKNMTTYGIVNLSPVKFYF